MFGKYGSILVSFFFALLLTSTLSWSINNSKKNLANIQPSWPHAWWIMHIYSNVVLNDKSNKAPHWNIDHHSCASLEASGNNTIYLFSYLTIFLCLTSFKIQISLKAELGIPWNEHHMNTHQENDDYFFFQAWKERKNASKDKEEINKFYRFELLRQQYPYFCHCNIWIKSCPVWQNNTVFKSPWLYSVSA